MKPAKEHKSKRKKEKKSKKRKRLQERLLDDLKLVSLAQLGDAKKVQELLDSQGDKAVHIYDSAGFTPLHQVQQRINENLIEVSLAGMSTCNMILACGMTCRLAVKDTTMLWNYSSGQHHSMHQAYAEEFPPIRKLL